MNPKSGATHLCLLICTANEVRDESLTETMTIVSYRMLLFILIVIFLTF